MLDKTNNRSTTSLPWRRLLLIGVDAARLSGDLKKNITPIFKEVVSGYQTLNSVGT